MTDQQKKVFFIIQVVTILGFLSLPFYLFGGTLFIGGDDSRLFYIFPWSWLNNIALYSWFHLSATGSNNPNQFIVPFLLVWSFLSFLLHSEVLLDYLSFSLPLILGFIFFQKLIDELVDNKGKNYQFIRYVGSLVYTLSPIIETNQLSVFLYSAWLIGLLPIITYYFIKYLKTGNFRYIFINTVWCIFLSFALSTIPWLLSFFLPLILSLLILISIFSKKNKVIFIRRSIVFFLILILSQAFWVYSFIINILFSEKNSFLGNVLSQNSADTFRGTVLSTASGNILYPLLNLSHRQITIDYNTPLKDIFFSFYDKTFLFDAVYIIVLFTALLIFKNFLSSQEKKYYLVFFIALLLSLFFFTVNIGPLKNIFLFMGYIPGFVMFRNFYDKFALGYILIFSIVITLSIVIVTRKFKRAEKILPLLVLFVVLFNLIPIKEVINKQLWTTQNIYSSITIPKEYFQFIQHIKSNVATTSNILSLPFNIAGYTIIKEQNTDNVFAGRSPIQLFTGVNDFSGNLSFPPPTTAEFVTDIKTRSYKDLNEFLINHNIGYVFVTNNIPQQVKQSYLFDKKVLPYEDQKFLQAITGAQVFTSTNGSYVLYKSKYPTSLFLSKNLTYQKINPVTFQLQLKNIQSAQQLDFLDSYSGGWKLYPEAHTSSSENELSYIFRKDIFADSQKVYKGYGNQWTIDPAVLKKNFSKRYYHVNPDGSLDMKLILYFKPQENFYKGAFISIITVLILCGYLFYSMRIKYEKET